MLFDTHAHMDDRAFDQDRELLLADLPARGLALVMNPGCSLESSRNADALSRRYDYIYAAVGSHPDAADEVNEAVLEQYRQLCRENPKIKAIGEIGLDYHYEDIPRDLQKASSMSGRPTEMPWRFWTNFPPSPACFTAIPALRKWQRNWSAGDGTSALPVC